MFQRFTLPPLQSLPPTDDRRREAQVCVKVGLHLGILGIASTGITFIQVLFVWCGRSFFPCWKRTEKLDGRAQESLFAAISTIFCAIGLLTGIVNLIIGCPERTIVLLNALRIAFGGIAALYSTLINVMRVAAIRRNSWIFPYPKTVVLTASLLMGGIGWVYLVPLIYIRNEGLGVNVGLYKIILYAFWTIVLFMTILCSLLGFFELMLANKWNNLPYHIILGCFVVGGFGMAIYTELMGGLWYRTILSLPASFRGGLGWILTIGVFVSHMAIRA
jgi:hypothetical protein